MKKEIVSRFDAISQELLSSSLHPVLQRVYANRDITSPAEVEKKLACLPSYQSLRQIDEAVACLYDALNNQKRILIVGDYDVDGAVSTTLMVRALRAFGANHVDFLIPNRFEHGYGLTPSLLEEALTFHPDVIVTVDNGITSVEAVALANQHHISVVVTDHHLPGDELPQATAIVNPNQPHDEFPSKNLAGVGVAFYVMIALRAKLREENWFEKRKELNLTEYLDLVALGTVADIVKLDQVNRIFVHYGLHRMAHGQCCFGIQALLTVAGKDSAKVSVRDLGFVVGPRLNAAGRLQDMSLGVRCLLSDDLGEAQTLALKLDALNRERREIEDKMQKEAFASLSKKDLPYGICLQQDHWHEGVIGILASRIKDRVHRPVIVFAGGESAIKGSARSVPGLHLRDVLASIDAAHPGLIARFGGHAMAAGLSLAADSYTKFSQIFDEQVRAFMNDKPFQPQIFTDGVLSRDDFSLQLAEILQDAGPWGHGFESPLFDGEFQLVDQRLVGQKHLKLSLAFEDRLLDAIVFYVNTNEWPNRRCERIRLVYRLDINEYQGRRSLQLLGEYLRAL